MDQKKIGNLLKELRNEKSFTQEQLAEMLNVSSRTVSRWETGRNMPDISLLVEIAELYDISIPEIINGERKSEKMNEEVKEVAETMADYAGAEKETIVKDIRSLSLVGVGALAVFIIADITGLHLKNEILAHLYGYSESLIYVYVLMFPFYTTGLMSKVQRRKQDLKLDHLPKTLRFVIAAIAAFVSAAMIKILLVKIF